MEWKWDGNGMEEVLDVGSSTHVAFDWIWFGEALDVISSVCYSLKIVLFIVLIWSCLLTCNGKR